MARIKWQMSGLLRVLVQALLTFSIVTSVKAFGETTQGSSSFRGHVTSSEKNPIERPLKDVLKETPVAAALVGNFSDESKNYSLSLAQNCEVYFKPDGSFGKVGATAQKVISSPKFNILRTSLEHSDVASVCPNFIKMSREQREGFWVWVLAGIEFQESHCGRVHRKDPMANGRIKGRLSVPVNGKAYSDSCVNIENDEGQIGCGLSLILRELNRSEDAKLFSPRAYYGVQRPKSAGHKGFRKFVASYPVCGN